MGKLHHVVSPFLALIAYYLSLYPVIGLIIRRVLPVIRELCHKPMVDGVYEVGFFGEIANFAAIWQRAVGDFDSRGPCS